MIPIAHIENDFPTKFGIPRQSGRVGALKARIVFEPEYRNVDACRGLEEFSHIDRKSTRLNSSHNNQSRMPSSA